MLVEEIQKNLINVDNEDGFTRFGSNRVVTFGITALASLIRDIIRTLGLKKGSIICFRYGYEAGIAQALVVTERYHFNGYDEYLRICEFVKTMSGVAHVEFKEVEFDNEGKLLRFTGTWRDSLEAYIWRSQFKKNYEGPVCVILAGMISGYTSAIFGQEVLVRELACETQGHQDYCTFEGRPLSGWGIDAQDSTSGLILDNQEEEMTQLQTALRQAWDVMERQKSEIRDLKNKVELKEDPHVIYRSEAMANVLQLAEKVAPTRSTVLLQGESGTGKEVIARFIHRHSATPDEPFLAINCAALPANLLESELFGHMRGSFTGADFDKKGLFIEAGSGTLFLDEVGDIPVEIQAKLLRAIQEKVVRQVGGVKEIPVQARIIAATNRELKVLVEEGRFREDLFFRLSVFPISIPPLRERREDILPLARHFLDKMHEDHPGFIPRSIRQMESYNWPGNVRELENWVEYAVILSGKERIRPEHLPADIQKTSFDPLAMLAADLPTWDELEKRYIRFVLQKTDHNKSDAARILGMGGSTLWRRLKEDAGEGTKTSPPDPAIAAYISEKMKTG
ncbi:MAG: sigma 54-interacting transcriptional regulator [Deltaproteobacteria bacterium]|nr:sigma 54-interacting transcriptional regulator [Deltaproteobacteria bacterium]